MKVLHINSSTRGDNSFSLGVAKQLIETIKQQGITVELDELHLFDENLPEFGRDAVGAKMALFSGTDADETQKRAWAEIKSVFDRFASADLYIINTPLWNNGIPYKLKQYIDLVTQPGWTFGLDMEKGYFGLMKNKKAALIQASGVYYEGIASNFGSDFSSPYLNDWMKFIGIDNVKNIFIAPSVVNSDIESTRRDALAKAHEVAKQLVNK